MKNNTFKQILIVVLIFMILIMGYIFSQLKKDDSARTPHYERYNQSNRLDKIRKGMLNK